MPIKIETADEMCGPICFSGDVSTSICSIVHLQSEDARAPFA